MRSFFVALILTAVVAVGIAGAGFLFADYWSKSPGPEAAGGAEETVVLLERGLGVNAIAGRLERAGVISDARTFSLWVRMKGETQSLKAGEYAFPSGASPREVLDILVEGKSIQHKVTIAEGITVAQALRLVADHPVLEGELPAPPKEGHLLPETYLFLRGTSRQDLIAKMAKAHEDTVAELWPGRQEGLPLATPEEAVILASIVEKETAIAEERPRVAAVFVNRLKRGMRLQSDPTIIYGLTGGEPLGRGIRKSELERATPYNTYIIAGLPPTPIALPGRASIEAVLNPPSTTELYFVADGTGGHVFASTYEEHQRNVARWRQVERGQNGG